MLARYGTPAQREQWLIPLLEGRIRSAFAMTEPAVASSDAANISIRIERDEAAGQYVINGTKWWTTGAGSLHCKLLILMGKTNPNSDRHTQQSQILVTVLLSVLQLVVAAPICELTRPRWLQVPTDTPGITFLRPMLAMGDVEAPKGHMEIAFVDVRVPFENILLGEGRGFEISQGRLGPGRIHHCMRSIGQAERCLALMCKRVQQRSAFGKKLSDFDTILTDIAKSRVEIENCRLLTAKAAQMMDQLGNRDLKTRQLLALVKAQVPLCLQAIVDRCIQVALREPNSQD